MIYDSLDCNIIFCHFWTFFCPFTPPTTQKNKILKKMRNMPEDIIILLKCAKNYIYMLYCSWDMLHDRQNCYFSFWAIFCSFTPLTAWKIKKIWKMKKMPGNLIILQMCTKNYDLMMYASWDMMCNRQMDRRMDGKSDI